MYANATYVRTYTGYGVQLVKNVIHIRTYTFSTMSYNEVVPMAGELNYSNSTNTTDIPWWVHEDRNLCMKVREIELK